MYYLSLCAVFKDETKWLKEWIEYHLIAGVDHFYLFLHDSGEELKKVKQIIREYEGVRTRNIITYYPFNYHSGDFQIKAYDLALRNYGKDTRWLGFVDLDEFVFPVLESASLKGIFQQYEDNEIKGLNASVCTFGDSYHISSPALQTRDLTFRAFDDRPCNFTSKQFFKTDKILHYEYGGNWWQCINEDYNMSKECKQPRPMNKIRVNHYAVRSQEDWDKKVNRNWPNDIESFKLTPDDWKHKHAMLNHNDIKDFTMNRFMRPLGQRLGFDLNLKKADPEERKFRRLSSGL